MVKEITKLRKWRSFDMIRLRMASHEDRTKIAQFIAQLNQEKEHHIGYCGEQQDEIQHTLSEEWNTAEGNISLSQSFVVAFEEQEQGEALIGVLGFDIDMDATSAGISAEVWGPFVQHEAWQEQAKQLWEYWLSFARQAPKKQQVDQYRFFINKANSRAIRFVESLHGEFKSEEVVLHIEQSAIRPNEQTSNPMQPLHPDFQQAFILLHDNTFPGTYYSGAEVIERIQEEKGKRRVFTCTVEQELAGYIYVEVEPEFGEASIEFIGVEPQYRGQGIGTQLLQQALSWMFSFEQIQSITLCVSADNSQALHVYEKAGFKRKHTLVFYTVSSAKS